MTAKQPWLHSAGTDGLFILSPPFLALLAVALFPAQFRSSSEMPVIYWAILIVLVDVAHVYSTLYRTYFNPGALKGISALLVAVPLCCYVSGVILHSISPMLFWRILAYLAVFHFIRQQYGFMRLYSRYETAGKLMRGIDKLAIYAATIYPIVYWHLAGGRNFNWFVEDDFAVVHNASLLKPAFALYLLILTAYLIKEISYVVRSAQFNIPRNLLIAGTFLSWYFGIVHFNGDMAFTTLNVISHGIPYMALVWIFEKRKYTVPSNLKSTFLRLSFGRYGIVYFLLLIVFFAYIEEGLWDGLIWKEHINVFSFFANLPKIESESLLTIFIPLLSLPQSTHYVLDGFIWKAKSKV